MRRPTLVPFLAAGLLLAACAEGSGGPPTTAPSVTGSGFSSLLLQPMNALPTCGPPPEPGEVDAIEGLLLPEGAVLQTENTTQGLIQVIGYVPLTPVQLLASYQERDDLEIVIQEHEQFESELLYELPDGTRAFVKSQVACATGSNLVAVVAPASATADLPTPSGAPTPTP